MGTQNPVAAAKQAVFAIAEIKSAVDGFDRGDTNVFDALDAIHVAVEGYRAASESRRDAA